MNNWVFSHNEGDTARYILGNLGTNNLICVGINPSTAVPNKLDMTLKKVRNIAAQNGYDGWVMLNIYPQRDTDPNNIHPEMVNEINAENCEAIRRVLQMHKFNRVWAAWGDDIEKRPFLWDCLSEIVGCFDENYTWLHIGDLTVKEHPRHPSRIGYDLEFREFNIHEYLAQHG